MTNCGASEGTMAATGSPASRNMMKTSDAAAHTVNTRRSSFWAKKENDTGAIDREASEADRGPVCFAFFRQIAKAFGQHGLGS